MQVVYKSRSLQKVCTDFSAASRKHGARVANIIQIRIAQIQSADNIESMVKAKVGRCHALKGQREGQYAMDLVYPYRLIFEKLGDMIQVVRIVEIVDYH